MKSSSIFLISNTDFNDLCLLSLIHTFGILRSLLVLKGLNGSFNSDELRPTDDTFQKRRCQLFTKILEKNLLQLVPYNNLLNVFYKIKAQFIRPPWQLYPQHLRRVKVSVEKGMNECQTQDHWEFSSKIYSNYFSNTN